MKASESDKQLKAHSSMFISRAYVVLAASTMIYFLALFPHRILSIIYVACIERYAVSRADAVYPMTIYVCMKSVSGILTTYLSSKIGGKATTILGGAISSIGLGACFFAEDILFVTISFGIVSGIGLSMNSSLILHFLRPYFKENFGFACGMTLNGSVVSRIVFAPVAEFLLEKYGLSGTFLIFGAILLNTIPASMLIKVKTAQINPSERSQNSLSKQTITSHKKSLTIKSNECYDNSVSLESIPASNASSNFSSHDAIPNIEPSDSNDSSKRSNNSTSSQRDESNLNSSTVSYHIKPLASNDSSKNYDHEPANMLTVYINEESVGKDVLGTKSTDEPLHNNNSSVDPSKDKIIGGLLDPCFLVILLTASCFMYIYVIGSSIIIDVSREKNLPRENEIYLLTIGPIPDVITNILIGKIIDKGIISNVKFSVILFLAYSALCACLVWANSFLVYISGVLLFGIITNGFLVMFPVLVTEFIDQNKQALAQSSKYMLYGVLCFTASPLIGHFRDNLGSYTGVLYVLSLIALACSVLITMLPFLSKCKSK